MGASVSVIDQLNSLPEDKKDDISKRYTALVGEGKSEEEAVALIMKENETNETVTEVATEAKGDETATEAKPSEPTPAAAEPAPTGEEPTPAATDPDEAYNKYRKWEIETEEEAAEAVALLPTPKEMVAERKALWQVNIVYSV